MFGTLQAWPVENGVRGVLMRGVNISGIAFDVLRTVDAVGSEFQWDLGSGFCGTNSSSSMVKSIDAFGQVGFYCWQIIRLAKGLAVKPKLGV